MVRKATKVNLIEGVREYLRTREMWKSIALGCVIIAAVTFLFSAGILLLTSGS
jgi:hypothetical protein